uniref:Uncharacterized protein n=1 Tax=Monopterus albus TaxID=43700 RepID=A0A3Q3ISR6_MONAL
MPSLTGLGNRPGVVLCILGLISLVMVVPILWWETRSHTHREKRANVLVPPELVFDSGKTSTLMVDACDILDCSGWPQQEQLRQSDKYISITIVHMIYILVTTKKDDSRYISTSSDLQKKIVIETGFVQKKIWLEWVQNAARKALVNISCVICAGPCPALLTVPSLLSDANYTHCMLELHMTENPSTPACRDLEIYYPLAPRDAVPPIFTAVKNNYTCVTNTNVTGNNVGTVSLDWCTITLNLTTWANATRLTFARSDAYWYCGGYRLLNILPPDWSGTCTVISLIVPVTLVKASVLDILSGSSHSSKEHHSKWEAIFDPTKFSPTYIDAIGIPRGVPDEYKFVDQVAAGFESALFWWVTINKNHLTNLTRDLANRLALDFILAEKGGVCTMIGQQCCTCIPNNTAPDGSISRALTGLKILSEEMAEHSGIQNYIDDCVRFDLKNAIIAMKTSLHIEAYI